VSPPTRCSPDRTNIRRHADCPSCAQRWRTLYRLQGLSLTADHVLVTSGATEALAAAILVIVSPGDEVVLFQPTYDAYLPLIERAGGIAHFVTLRPPGWRLAAGARGDRGGDWPRTRLLILNDPLNPAARVFDADEIAMLGRLCVTTI
jgi:N-succinyldiaminopimelate aminotransferase